MTYKAICGWCKFHRKCQKWSGEDVCLVCFGESDRQRKKKDNKYAESRNRKNNKKTHKNKYAIIPVQIDFKQKKNKDKQNKQGKKNKHKKVKFKVRFIEIFNVI